MNDSTSQKIDPTTGDTVRITVPDNADRLAVVLCGDTTLAIEREHDDGFEIEGELTIDDLMAEDWYLEAKEDEQ